MHSSSLASKHKEICKEVSGLYLYLLLYQCAVVTNISGLLSIGKSILAFVEHEKIWVCTKDLGGPRPRAKSHNVVLPWVKAGQHKNDYSILRLYIQVHETHQAYSKKLRGLQLFSYSTCYPGLLNFRLQANEPQGTFSTSIFHH